MTSYSPIADQLELPALAESRESARTATSGDKAAQMRAILEEQAISIHAKRFFPEEPKSLSDTGLTLRQLEAIILKYLFNAGIASGNVIARQVGLPMSWICDILRQLKNDQLVAYRQSHGYGDFEYELTRAGEDRAVRLFDKCTYCGAAPVNIATYAESVRQQSPSRECPTAERLAEALSDLKIDRENFCRLGQAIISGGAIFLYGSPGNGKTSMAERLTAAFGSSIWVPRSVEIDGEIMRIFDPAIHREVPREEAEVEGKYDSRWVQIERPTVVVGGELTLESLEPITDKSSGTLEAPVHIKANGGSLVIDDFGRQRVSTSALLNRWIVPLEKRYDYLNTPSGRKIQVPFEQLVVFATNLEPADLVDEAFLRRIPYKIRVKDPTEAEFRGLLCRQAHDMGVTYDEVAVNHLIRQHYGNSGRPFRYCHVRDLLNQVVNHSRFFRTQPALTFESMDMAASNYFSSIPMPTSETPPRQ